MIRLARLALLVVLFGMLASAAHAGGVLIETYGGEVIKARRIINLATTYAFRYQGNRIRFPVERMRSLRCEGERGNGPMVLTRRDGKSFSFTGSNVGIVTDWKQGHYAVIRYEFDDEVTEAPATSWIKSDKVREIRFE